MPEQVVLHVPIDEVLLLQANLEYVHNIAIVSYKATKPATKWYCAVTVSYQAAADLYSFGLYVGIDKYGRAGL